MAKLRVVDPVGHYHLNANGNFGRSLYEEELHRVVFLRLYERVARKCGWVTLGYCLMTTHYHVLLRLTGGLLSEGMQQLNGGFSRRMNAIYGRTGRGHLFKNRFHDEPVLSDEHFKAVVRYIALNPVEAGICSLPEEFRWSSHRAVLGLDAAAPFLAVDELLSHFGADRARARGAYRRLVSSGLVLTSDQRDGRVNEAARERALVESR